MVCDDDYVEESQRSCGDQSASDIPDMGEADDYFSSRAYESRECISTAVVEYNAVHGRAFKIVSSDYRRFKATCVDPDCSFVVTFAYGKAFGSPTAFVPHSCDPTQVDQTARETVRQMMPAHLARLPAARQFVIDQGRTASPVQLQQHLAKHGHRARYRACVDVCNRLKKEIFESDRSQYQLMLSYIHELNKRGHNADIDIRSNVIARLAIVFKQGIQAANVFADRGLCLDGTFMKHEPGGTLLVACLRNSNNEIQIVGVAWVSGETKDNWTWFVKWLLRSIRQPSFVISDRDKGLVPTLQTEAPAIPHFSCLRHLMENFNAKFKNKALRDDAWRLGKALSIASYTKRADALKLKNAVALEWLEAADKVKWSAAHSPCPRFGTMTSNNVESTNSALLQAREKPLLDCLMDVEQYVGRR
jgi:hypothetical protein